jgi:hypothetical protein
MQNETGFIGTILLSLTSNAIWALLGGGIIYSIYCRFRLQSWIKKSLLGQPKNLTDLQNTYINTIKISRLNLDTYYPDGLDFKLPLFLESEEIKHYGKFSKWTLLGETRKAFSALCSVLKRYEIKVNSISGSPSREQAYALLCLGMNIYYQMITISVDWNNFTPVDNDVDDFTRVVADYFGVVLDPLDTWELICSDLQYQRSIGLAPDIRDL